MVADVQEQFQQQIIADFISGYVHGRTPNPCVLCNPTDQVFYIYGCGRAA
jgi:tRNA-uridine 2-sulfurtransferase